MSIPSSHEIRRTKQVIPAVKIKKWAEEAGFTIRNSGHGSSHYRCAHREYPDIVLTMLLTTSKVSSQRDFADALLEIEKRNLQKAFSASAENEQKILRKIPDHLQGEVDLKTGSLVIRDRQMPQLGMTIAPSDFHLIENKIHNILEPRKRGLFTLMNQARMLYDIDISIPKRGTFDGILSHDVYGISPIVIRTYQAGDDTDQCSEMIGSFIKEVIAKDQEHAARMDRILSMPFVQEIEVVSHARRGDRTYVLEYESPKHRKLKIDFHGYSHQRVNPDADEDIHHARMTDAELASLEKRVYGIAHGHAQAAYEARL